MADSMEAFSYPAKVTDLHTLPSIKPRKTVISNERRNELLKFSKKLGVEFKDLNFLNTALTHTSYANEKERQMDDNERLEFLGDAVLELASSTYLYNNFKSLSEGELTKTRASIVCQDTLAKLAKKLELGDLLLLGNGEESNGGRERTSILEDAFEAIIGAIYLDQGWVIALDYVIRQLAPEFESARIGNYRRDYKTVLQEIVQQNPLRKITYVELSVNGPDHMRLYEYAVDIDGKIYGSGNGRSKKIAEQMAAKKTLELIKDSNFSLD